MTKSEMVVEALSAGWCQADSLATSNGWKLHTLRAVISVEARKRGIKVERRREDDKTYYRTVAK